jgi:hypothetical protein
MSPSWHIIAQLAPLLNATYYKHAQYSAIQVHALGHVHFNIVVQH